MLTRSQQQSLEQQSLEQAPQPQSQPQPQPQPPQPQPPQPQPQPPQPPHSQPQPPQPPHSQPQPPQPPHSQPQPPQPQLPPPRSPQPPQPQQPRMVRRSLRLLEERLQQQRIIHQNQQLQEQQQREAERNQQFVEFQEQQRQAERQQQQLEFRQQVLIEQIQELQRLLRQTNEYLEQDVYSQPKVNILTSTIEFSTKRPGLNITRKIVHALKTNSNLRKLSFKHGLNTTGMRDIFMSLITNTKLRFLGMNLTEFDDSSAAKLSRALMVNTTLKSLRLSGEISIRGSRVIAFALRENTGLKGIHIPICDTTDLRCLGIALQKNTTLEHVFLKVQSCNLLEFQKFLDVVKTNQNLKTLRFSRISDAVLGVDIAETYRASNFLTTLILTNVHCILAKNLIRTCFFGNDINNTPPNTLKALTIDANGLDHDLMTLISSALKTNTCKLEKLKLFCNDFRMDESTAAISGVWRIFEALITENRTLVKIKLDIKDDSIDTKCLDMLMATLKQNPKLLTLSLPLAEFPVDYTVKLNETLAQNKTLKKFSIFGKNARHMISFLGKNTALNDFCVQDSVLLSEAHNLKLGLLTNKTLTILILAHCSLNDEGAVLIAEGLMGNRSLFTLGLNSNDIGDDGVTAIANALKVNQVLKLLDLRNNIIGSRGGLALAQALKKNKCLGCLCVDPDLMQDLNVSPLAWALKENDTLTQLSYDRNIEDHSFDYCDAAFYLAKNRKRIWNIFMKPKWDFKDLIALSIVDTRLLAYLSLTPDDFVSVSITDRLHNEVNKGEFKRKLVTIRFQIDEKIKLFKLNFLKVLFALLFPTDSPYSLGENVTRIVVGLLDLEDFEYYVKCYNYKVLQPTRGKLL